MYVDVLNPMEYLYQFVNRNNVHNVSYKMSLVVPYIKEKTSTYNCDWEKDLNSIKWYLGYEDLYFYC